MKTILLSIVLIVVLVLFGECFLVAGQIFLNRIQESQLNLGVDCTLTNNKQNNLVIKCNSTSRF